MGDLPWTPVFCAVAGRFLRWPCPGQAVFPLGFPPVPQFCRRPRRALSVSAVRSGCPTTCQCNTISYHNVKHQWTVHIMEQSTTLNSPHHSTVHIMEHSTSWNSPHHETVLIMECSTSRNSPHHGTVHIMGHSSLWNSQNHGTVPYIEESTIWNIPHHGTFHIMEQSTSWNILHHGTVHILYQRLFLFISFYLELLHICFVEKLINY